MRQKFGEFLIEKGVATSLEVVQALNTQRRRNLIPIGEIALHDKLLTADQVLNIFRIQDTTSKKFGEIALHLGYMNARELEALCRKQQKLQCHLGDILIEMKKLSRVQLKDLLTEYYNSQHFDPKADKQIYDIALTSNDHIVFSDKETVCPVCGEKSVQFYINEDMYEASKTDIDLKPSKFIWKDDLLEEHPPFFFDIWECPYCHFATLRSDYDDPAKDIPPSLHNFRKKVLALMSDDPDVQFLLEALGSISGDPFMTNAVDTVKKYLIAIYIHSKLPLIREQEGIPLANLCLHLGWLFREIHTMSEKNQIIKELQSIKNDVISFWPDIPLNERSALKMAIFYYDIGIFQSRTLVEHGVEHIILQKIGRIYIRLRQIQKARKILLDTVMNGNRQITALKRTVLPDTNEYNRRFNKEIVVKLEVIISFVRETKALLELCSSLKSKK